MKIAILHLSDFHIKENDDLVLIKIDKMLDSLNVMGKIDEYIILFSGDLAYSGKINEYKKSRKIIGKLIAGLKSKSGKAFVDLWMVPGNHDLNLNAVKRTKQDIENYYKENTINAMLDNEIKLLENFYTTSHANAHNWTDKLLTKRFSTYGDNEYTIQFNLINTAMFSTLDSGNNMLHYFPTEKMFELKKRDNANICITVMHHTSQWFYWLYQSDLEKSIINNSEFLLVGHDHVDKTKHISIDNSEETWVSCAGEMSFSDMNSEDSFNVLFLNTDNNLFSGYIFNWIRKEKMYVSTSVIMDSPIQIHKNQLTPLPSFINTLKEDDYISSDDFTKYFVFPKLIHRENNKYSKSIEITTQTKFDDFLNINKKLMITGASNAGKTTLLKSLFTKMPNGIVPLIVLIDFHTKINPKNFIKRLFEDQYGDSEILYEKYKQLDASKKIIFIDGWDKLLDNHAQNRLYDIISENFEYIVISTNSIQTDIVESVKEEINFDDTFKELKIKPFFAEKRNQLVKNICTLNSTYSDNEITQVNKLIDSLFLNNSNLFSSDPAFIIRYTDYFTKDHAYDYTKGEATFSKVFEHGINSSIIKYAKQSEIDEIITVFQELAGYIYISHEDLLSIEEFKSIIEQYKNDYDVSISSDIILEVGLKSKLLKKTADLSLHFSNKNILSYFIAKHLYRLWQSQDDISGIEAALKNICFGINSDIILFLTYLTNNTKIVMSIANHAGLLLEPWQELDFEKNSFSFLNTTSQDVVTAPTQKDKDRLNSQKEITEEHISQQELIEAKGIFDYNESDIDQFQYRLDRALKYTEMLCKSLPAFNNLLKKEQKDVLVELIYSYPQKIVFALLEPIDKNIDDICSTIISLAEESGATTKYNKPYGKEDVLRMINSQSRLIILGLYDHFAELATSHKSLEKLLSKEANTVNQQIYTLMVIEHSNNTDAFIRKADSMLKSANNESIKYMVKLIARKHLLSNPTLSHKKQQQIVDKFLDASAKKESLLQKK